MSDENNKQHEQEHAPNSEGAGDVQSFSWKRLLAKKWVFPAAYMAAAAIILSLIWAYQGSDQRQAAQQDDFGLTSNQAVDDNAAAPNSDAAAVSVSAEKMSWPVSDRSAVHVIAPYFDNASSNEEKQAAMIQSGNTFTPNVGVSLATSDNKSFDVVAALSGTVTRVATLPLVGNLVEITHDDGLKTIYESLTNIKVQQNATVSQGDVIAQAGRNELEKDLGVHLHFEIQKDGVPVNPSEYLTDLAAGSAAEQTQTQDQDLQAQQTESSQNSDNTPMSAEDTQPSADETQSTADDAGMSADDMQSDATDDQSAQPSQDTDSAQQTDDGQSE